MKILLGILVWNEEDIIKQTLQSLFKQSIFKKDEMEVELIVLANGCTDNTVKVSEKSINSLRKSVDCKLVPKVIDSKTPGKIKAWNDVMYKYSSGDEQYIIFMDGDIIFLQDDNLEKLIDALEKDQNAWISTDYPVKDIQFSGKKSLKDRLSLAFSKFTKKANGQLCAQLYCARSSFLRRFSIPEGLVAEDTYIKLLAVTNGLTEKPNEGRLIKVENTSHLFEAYTDFNAFFKNQIRQTISFTIWRIFKKEILKKEKKVNALEYSKEKYFENPEWFRGLIQKSFSEKKFWHIYSGAFSVRIKRLKLLSFPNKLIMFMPVILATIVDSLVFLVSNHKIKKGNIKNIWPDTQSSKLAGICNSKN